MQSLTFTDIIARNPGYIGNIESEKARFRRVRFITRRARTALGKTRVLNTILLRHIYL
jgi:hypothetical protein